MSELRKLWEITCFCFALICIALLPACVRSSSSSPAPLLSAGVNAEGIGGGDLAARYEGLRQSHLIPAVQAIVDGKLDLSLCRFSECPAGAPCSLAPALTEAQILFCRNFLTNNAAQLLERLKSPLIKLVVTTDELFVNGVPVVARTTLGPTGSIEISHANEEKFGLSEQHLEAILIHEFLHKVQDLNSGITQDNRGYGPFTGENGGSSLLTAAGFAVVFASKAVPFPKIYVTSAPKGLNTQLSIYHGQTGQLLERPASRLEPYAEYSNRVNLGASPRFPLLALAAAELPSIGNSILGLIPGARKPTPLIESPLANMNLHGGSIAVADLDGDGQAELVTGAAPGGEPRVAVYDMKGNAVGDFVPYHPNFVGGVRVTAGDTDGDGMDNIIMVPSKGQTPRILIYRGYDLARQRAIEVLPGDLGLGGEIAAGDINGDSRVDIALSHQGRIRIYCSPNFTLCSQLEPYFAMGGRAINFPVAMGDLDGDGKAELAVTWPFSGPIKVFRFESSPSAFSEQHRPIEAMVIAVPNGSAFSSIAIGK